MSERHYDPNRGKPIKLGPSPTESKMLAEHSIRWCKNILGEIMCSHIGPNFPQSRIILQDVLCRMEELQDRLKLEK